MNYRCPVCFEREIDMDMLYDEEKDEYYCLRCPYVGDEADILQRYEHTKSKYRDGFRRITEFE
ncbi:MAG: hypothetical protein ACYS8K_03480 [Planctomycetota bacterium]